MDPITFFPHPSLREFQKEAIYKVYDAIARSRKLFLEAPSGFGKTSVLLCGSLPYITYHDYGLVYVVRTYREIDRVVEELRNFEEKLGVKFNVTVLKGKREQCVNESIPEKIKKHESFNLICDKKVAKNECIYFENFYRKNHLLESILRKNKHYSLEEIYNLSSNLYICPYELQKFLVNFSNIVITVYNNILSRDAFSYLKNWLNKFSQKILIIDEAHNIIDYIINLHSISVNFSNIEKTYLFQNEIKELISIINDYLKNELKYINYKKMDVYDFLNFIYKKLGLTLNNIIFLIKNEISEINYQNINILFNLYNLFRGLLFFDPNSQMLFARFSDDTFFVDLIMLNPAKYFREIFQNFKSVILASATLEPLDFFTTVFNMNSEEYDKLSITLTSKRIRTIFVTNINTRFLERNDELYFKLVEIIEEACKAINGGVAVFTASYEIISGLLNAGLNGIKRNLYVEHRGMSNEELKKIVENFEANPHDSVILAVQGGRLSEGEDFHQGAISVVLLVGIPYETPSPIVEEKINYFERNFPEKGWDYAYLLPALRKSIQAIGRSLRSHNPIIVFLDSRFLSENVLKYIPLWLKENRIVIAYSKGKLKRYLARLQEKSY